MLTDYYKQELRKLKDIAKDFSRENPALTKALSGSNADPDASRILEGVAFLTANIRHELDTQFPNLLYSLAQLVCPQYIRPLPSATMIAFQPKSSLAKPLTIEQGTYIDSKESTSGSCRFRTTEQIEMMPLKLTQVLEHSRGADIQFGLKFELINTTLDQLPFDKIRLYIGGEYEEACDIHYLLAQHTNSVTVAGVKLPVDVIQPAGIEDIKSTYPKPDGLTPAFDLLQQYFLFPEKLLYIDIDLSLWQQRGSDDQFTVELSIKKPSFEVSTLTNEHFHLYVAPAVNLFNCDSESILISPSQNEYQLLPNAGSNKAQFDIFSVDTVTSNARGVETPRNYQLFGGSDAISKNTQAIYELNYKQTNTTEPQVFLKLGIPEHSPIEQNEILKAKLTCSNGEGADSLHIGDISVATSNTPELVTFQNVTSPSESRRIPLDGDMLWQLISHLSLNYLSINDASTLKNILTQYIAPDTKAKSQRLSNEKRIESITKVSVEPGERLLNNAFVHGQNITVTIKPDHFSSVGDKYLFASVLDKFFASSAPINVYSEFAIEDFFSGEVTRWPAQLGKRSMQ